MTITSLREHSNWEFLPGYVRDIPVYFFWLYFFIKSGHPFFFSNINPGLPFSGFVEVSKYAHLKHFDMHYLPKMAVISAQTPLTLVEEKLGIAGLYYPIIVKPNTAGRNGTNVQKISTSEELEEYMHRVQKDILVQEIIDYPLEFGVFYYRLPSEEKGHLTGMVGKDFLYVEGTGGETLSELVAAHPRAKHYKQFLEVQHEQRRNEIVPRGEIIQLSYIGNHCKGSIFYDRSSLITPELEELFDQLSKKVPGFYCGRYDLKAESIEELYKGNFKILELNGVISEPTWIYDPSRSFWKAYKVMFEHWALMYRVSKANRRAGHKYISLKDARRLIRTYGV